MAMGNEFTSLILSVMLCGMACLAVSLTTSTDESALLALKAHVTSDPSSILARNWTQGSSVCNWVGVSCGLRHQRVTALELPNMSLSGTIPEEIGNLSFLASFNLSYNSFHGHLPLELGMLHRLKSLDLRSNELRGNIPTSLGSLRKLEVMRLSFNKFSGSIPSTIFNISSLRRLSMANNSLEGTLPTDLCNNLLKLQELYLGSNMFIGELPTAMFNISSLVIFNISDNRISGGLPKYLCHQLPKLQILDLFGNQLSGGIPSVQYCKGLVVLRLSHNKFSGSIPSQIGNLSTLRVLDLSRNDLAGTIPVSIGNMSKLEVIELGENQIQGNIPQEFGQTLNLKWLGLGINKLTGEIPRSIFNISTLQLLRLAENRLSGNLPSTLGHTLPNLQIFTVYSNELGGRIPSSISNASKLSLIELGDNSFSGEVPTTLGNLPLLETLDLGLNQLINDPSALELSFISSLTNCRNLKNLIIRDNPLNGILPKSLGSLSTSLQKFDATNCGIRGMIPSQIGNLSNLVQLYLGLNDLIGTIPRTLGQLRMMQGLMISGTLIQGFIPVNLCNLTNLYGLDLSNNKLLGTIPGCLGHSNSLRFLYLSNNKLGPEIPSTLWSLNDLLALDLSYNVLTGSLPPEIGNLKHATLLNLSNNQLTGQIPSTIEQLQFLQYMDLSHNSLSGVIPKSMEKLLDLRYFNVSFNKLSGEIPDKGPFVNFTAQSFLQNYALCGLLVRPCNNAHKKSRTAKFPLKYILAPIVSVGVVAALLICRLMRKSRNFPVQVDPPPAVTHKRVTYQEILSATNYFSEENLAGRGSLGLVYKGTFSDGMVAAIKVFDAEIQSAFKSFDAECEIMCTIRHRNLVKVISSCSNLDFKALVLQYMPNGDLDKWLYSHNNFLNFIQRLDIMIDVASGLGYLHHCLPTPVVHCDLKPANILLDEDMAAHVGDFSIAKLMPQDMSTRQTKTLGTIGYMAPEYGIAGIVSTMADIYSYGILLMETFTRKKPTDNQFSGEVSLKDWVLESFPNTFMEVVDANLLRVEGNSSSLQDCLLSLFRVALECTQNSPEKRTNMIDALWRLKKIKAMFQKNYTPS